MTTPVLTELDQRKGDGLTVTLLWDPETNDTFVHVDDHKRAQADVYDVKVPVGTPPLNVFWHPYAYRED